MGIPEQIQITLLCLFCGAPLEGPEDAEYASGDMIKCNNCEELNDYDSVIEVAKEKGIEQLSADVEEHFKKELGKIFK